MFDSCSHCTITDGTERSLLSDKLLGNLLYVSKGLVINAHESLAQGAFEANDLLQNAPDALHSKPFVEGKDIAQWTFKRVRFLEWGTHRAPALFSRRSFPELLNAPEKLLAARSPGFTPKVVLDKTGTYWDASSVGFVPWHLLHGVMNTSIAKTAKYTHERTTTDEMGLNREERERLSQQFAPGYLLAIMNSRFAQAWLQGKRRSRIHIYPDDWKALPIPNASSDHQQALVELVDDATSLHKQHGVQLLGEALAKSLSIQSQINERVNTLYDEALDDIHAQQIS